MRGRPSLRRPISTPRANRSYARSTNSTGVPASSRVTVDPLIATSLDHSLPYNTSIRQVRTPRYVAIAEDLHDQIRGRHFAPGEYLPSEAALSQHYQVSRITVRKALERLRDELIVESRQGSGWFVAFRPLEQTLGSFGTIEEQLAEKGVTPRRKVLSSTRVTARGRLEEILGSGEFLEVRRLNLVDEIPFARVTVWLPAAMAEGFSLRSFEEHSFYDLLSRSPLLRRPLVSARQTIAATAISARDAALLNVPTGSPALMCERITFDLAGLPVLFSEFVFPGSRTQFVTDLTSEVGSIAPSGLRLVED